MNFSSDAIAEIEGYLDVGRAFATSGQRLLAIAEKRDEVPEAWGRGFPLTQAENGNRDFCKQQMAEKAFVRWLPNKSEIPYISITLCSPAG